MVLPAMNDEEGRAVTSIEELNDLWRRHFENMEDGFSISKEELLTRCNDSQNQRATPTPSWNEIPSLHDLERSLRQNRYGKSALFDGIPSDACHKFAHVIARAFFPLFVKQTLLIREPVGFKGGVLVHAFKHKGSAKECKNYRALMVSSVLAKSAHRILRNDLMQTFQEGALPLQVGGLPGKGVGQGAQCLWAFSSMCRQKKVSAAFLFVDIRQAFYRVIRSHVVDIGTFDESVERLFRTLKLPSNSFADFVKEIESRTAVQEAGVSPFLAAHLTESMLYTWFQLPTDPGISQTRKGSRPGDNLADLLFSFSFKKILKSVMEELKAMEIDLSFETIADRNPYPYQQATNKEICFDSLGPVWADDLAILIWDESPHRIIEKTAVVAQVLIDALAIRGMDANLDRGKTELIFDLRGHGAHEAKAKIFRHADPVIPVCSRLLGDIFVRVVTSYKHLGTIYTSGGKLQAEIRQRLGQARQEFRRHRKTIYSNPQLAATARVSIFQTMVISSLMFDVAVWPEMSKREQQAFESGVLGLYNSVALAIWGEQTFSWRTNRMLARLCLPHPEVMLRVARLRHLQHLCLKADDFIWGFLHLELQWLQCVRADLDWMRQQIPRRLPQVDPHDDWAPWLADMHYGRRWKRNVNIAQRHAVLQMTKQSDWHMWHSNFLDVLKTAGLWQPGRRHDIDGGFPCLRCKKCFKSEQAWSVHAFTVHGRCTPARRYADGTQCAICLKEYAYHSRLVNHLRHSTRCVRELQRRGLVTAPEPSVGSAYESSIQATKRCIPVLRAHGPREAIPTEPDHEDHWNCAEEHFIESVLDVLERVQDEETTASAVVSMIWHALQDSILRPGDIRTLLFRTATDYIHMLDVDDPDEKWRYDVITEAMDTIEQDWHWQWLFGHLHGAIEVDHSGDGTIDAIKEVEKLVDDAPCRPRVERPFASRQLVFLHLFSGPRRPGDLQEAIELFANERNLSIRALSVDVVISLEYGDILRQDTQKTFIDALVQGWICGMAAGPPCETWSRAREHQLTTGDGPRPVRSADQPEGLSQLSLRELRQVLFGSQLLAVAAVLLTLCWIHGICGVLEHPAEPPRAASPSIWKLPIFRYLAKQSQVKKLTIMQGYYGAASAKPTTLMFTHPPDGLERLFQNSRTQETLPLKASIGRQSDGSFATAGLKTYPRGLCSAIALAWGHSFLKRTPTDVDMQPPAVYEKVFESLHSRIGSEVMEGADFCIDAQYQPV